jgi:hypothetical protein
MEMIKTFVNPSLSPNLVVLVGKKLVMSQQIETVVKIQIKMSVISTSYIIFNPIRTFRWGLLLHKYSLWCCGQVRTTHIKDE